MSPSHSVMRLTTLVQRNAIASPIRVELLESLRHAEIASAADLARLTGRSPTAVHYHVSSLRRAGLIIPAGRRASGKRGETLYRTAADAFEIAAQPDGSPAHAAASRTALALLRLAQREVARTLTRADICVTGPARNFHLRRLRAPLRPHALARANALLDQLEKLFTAEFEHAAQRAAARTTAPDPAAPVTLTFSLTPAERAQPGTNPETRGRPANRAQNTRPNAQPKARRTRP